MLRRGAFKPRMQHKIVIQAGPLQYLVQHILLLRHLKWTILIWLSRSTAHEPPCDLSHLKIPSITGVMSRRVLEYSRLSRIFTSSSNSISPCAALFPVSFKGRMHCHWVTDWVLMSEALPGQAGCRALRECHIKLQQKFAVLALTPWFQTRIRDLSNSSTCCSFDMSLAAMVDSQVTLCLSHHHLYALHLL